MSKRYDSGATFQSAPKGNHGAILIRIVDIGTQKGEYKGEPTIRRQEIWTWETPLELMEDGQPFIISKFYTSSLGEKSNLCKDLTNWLGNAPNKNDFDPEAMLGKPCQISVVENADTGKRKVSMVASLTKGVKLPEKPHNPLVYFSLEEGEFKQDVFDELPQGIQGMITKSPEYLSIVGGVEDVEVEPDDPSDIPF